MDNDESPEIDLSRRGIAGAILATLGISALSGCADGSSEGPDTETTTQAANGTAMRWVDTVLGGAPPAPPTPRTTGDLATKTSANLGNAIVAIAKGCVTAGDGGGGVFYWSSTNGTDNGGTVIVPNGNVGSVGPCWRKIKS